MFAKRMGSEKSGPEVLQDAFFEKERPNRYMEGREGALVTCIILMTTALVSFL